MLIGVSLGPGDPSLLTLKAVEELRSSSKVFVPGKMAYDLASPYCQPEILDFPMIEDVESLEKIWAKNADLVASYASSSKTAFACIGDVNTFSTFTHLSRLMKERYPTIDICSVPGVGVIQALASRFNTGIDSSFLVSDGSPIEIAIRMKATRPRKMAEDLRADGFEDFILGINLCTSEERILKGDMPEKSGYFSVLLARKNKK